MSRIFPRPLLRPGRPYFAGAPLLVAHRGGAALAPENTVEAFRRALEIWDADMLEMDVHLTRDGRVVILHDPTVDRTTDGSGAVREMPYEEIADLDAGHRFTDPEGEAPFRGKGLRIPLFEEVLERFPRTRLNVEIKAAEAAGPTLEILRRHGAEHRVLIAVFDERSRRGARGHRGPWGASRRQILRFLVLRRTPLAWLATPRADVFQVPVRRRGIRIVTPGFVREAQRRNIPVHVWTVDDEATMRRLLAWGVDGIQTDRPDRLARILTEEYGRPPAPGISAAGGEP